MNYIKLFETFRNLLTKNEIKTILTYPSYKGTYKLVFEYNNKIIKFLSIEDSSYEILNCIKQKNINLPILPKIYEIGKIKKRKDTWFIDLYKKLPESIFNQNINDIYYIIEEKINISSKLTKDIEKLLSLYSHWKLNFNYKGTGDILYDLQIIIYDKWGLYLESFDYKEISILRKYLDEFKKTLDVNLLNIYNDLVKSYTLCKNNNIIISDTNQDNYGLNKNGELVIIDLEDSLNFSYISNGFILPEKLLDNII